MNTRFKVGNRVINLYGNKYKMQIGIVIKIRNNSYMVKFEDNTEILFSDYDLHLFKNCPEYLKQ